MARLGSLSSLPDRSRIGRRATGVLRGPQCDRLGELRRRSVRGTPGRHDPLAVVDLYRVTDGRIVEHWDVSEEITPAETWVNTGKFYWPVNLFMPMIQRLPASSPNS